MKLEINDRGTKEYYDEFLYIANNKNKFRSNPYSKVGKASTSAFIYSGISLVLGLLFLVLYMLDKNNIYLYVIIFFGFIFLLSLLLIFLVFKRLNLLVNTKGVIVLEIDDKGIEISKDDIKYDVLWDEISNVIINKLTISFIPIDNSKAFITIDIKYKKEIVSVIKELKKDSLLIDNS